jgi:hypothetical protein
MHDALAGAARLARHQYALVSRPQAVAVGMTERQVDYLLEVGGLLVVHETVYRFPGAPVTWEQRALAATMAAGPAAFASHRTAARIWNLIDPDAGVPIEIVVPYPQFARLDGVIVHRSRDLAPHRITTRHRIPITNPMLTLADLGAVLPRADVEDALERGLVNRLYSIAAVEELHGQVARPGRRGAGALGRILDARALGRDRPDSLLEARMAKLLARRGLPLPAFRHLIRAPGLRSVEVDFFYSHPLAIEVLGFRYHSTRRRFEIDIERRNVLSLLGIPLLEFTWHAVVRRPDHVAETVEAKLGGGRVTPTP